jgi:hypothetical protein
VNVSLGTLVSIAQVAHDAQGPLRATRDPPYEELLIRLGAGAVVISCFAAIGDCCWLLHSQFWASSGRGGGNS